MAEVQKMRQGTKSCSECRQRKLKCIKDSDQDTVCTNCKERGRVCVPQQYKRRSLKPSGTSSDRISHLEQRIASLTAAIQDKPLASTGPTNGLASSEGSDELEQLTDIPVEGPSPPAHLKLLFDNSLIGSDRSLAPARMPQLSDVKCSSNFLERSRARLRHLLPPREDVARIGEWAAPWLSLYHAIFPPATAIWNGHDLMQQYDNLNDRSHPVDLSVVLLNLAITVQQVPANRQPQLKGWKSIDTWVQAVGAVIEATIIAHTGIASTLEGMETTIMYIRLQLGSGLMKKLWLTLRRTIAVAEVAGLPRAASAARRLKNNGQSSDYRVITLWDSICVTDRMAATMLNLPSATVMYRRPADELLVNGEVNAQAYLFRLSEIAMQVQDLDEAYATGQLPTDVFPQILTADAAVRQLGRQTPAGWWEFEGQHVNVRHLLQLWHFYFLARIHLNAAITANDEHNQYAYNRMSCLEACSSLATRYTVLRKLLPVGLFLARVIDMQVVTATVFLVLACFDSRHGADTNTNCRSLIVDEVLKTMDYVTGQPGADFAREAAAAIRALRTLLQRPAGTEGSQNLTLRVPLLGKVHISRKAAPTPAQGQSNFTTNAVSSGDNFMPVANFSPEQALPTWLMEYDMNMPLQDPVMIDDWDQWFQSMDTGF